MLEHNNRTFFKNIVKLPASHNLQIDCTTGKLTVEKYYAIRKNNKITALSLDESKELFRKEFNRSIKYRLRSDVTVGTCLSGGVDSSSVVSEAQKLLSGTDKRMTAITAKCSELELDDTPNAKIMAERYELNWKVVLSLIHI